MTASEPNIAPLTLIRELETVTAAITHLRQLNAALARQNDMLNQDNDRLYKRLRKLSRRTGRKTSTILHTLIEHADELGEPLKEAFKRELHEFDTEIDGIASEKDGLQAKVMVLERQIATLTEANLQLQRRETQDAPQPQATPDLQAALAALRRSLYA